MVNGHKIFSKTTCWYIQALKRPGKPDLSILFNHLSNLSLVSWTATAPFKVWSKHFPRLFTGLFFIVGIYSPESLNRSSDILPFFNRRDLVFVALKLILAYVVSFSIPFSSHLALITDVVVIVMSSIYARISGCLRPDLVVGALHSTSATFISILIAKAKRVAEMVQPFSNLCHADLVFPDIVLI